MAFLPPLSRNVRIALTGISALSVVILVELRPWHTEIPGPAASNVTEMAAGPAPLIIPDLERHLREDTSASIRKIDPELEQMLVTKNFGVLIDRLLQLAADAVGANDDRRLIQVLSLLGQVSIERGQLDSAEVYLFEALDLMGERVNGPEGAEVYMQLGRTYLRSREIARSAGQAYDALQIGRLQMRLGKVELAEQSIRLAIDRSLEINRYNVAASAYLSLVDLHEQLGDRFQAEQAVLEAVRLFSASGQETAANEIIDVLRSSGIDEWRLDAVEAEATENLNKFYRDISQIGVARDYQRLYRYYLSENNLSRAWHFRLLASKSLKNVSKRSLFHRQQGVLALLYNSNEAMAKAKRFFSEASDQFSRFGMIDRWNQTAALKRDVY